LNISKKQFGTSPEGHEVSLYSITADGFSVEIINYGGAVRAIRVPDRQGNLADVVLGCETLPEYIKNSHFFGALIGRFANRIALGRFTLQNTTYQLAQNNGANHLHGGVRGFDKVVWQPNETMEDGAAVLRLRYLSKDGEEEYPGNLEANVTYTISANREIRIDYHAVTDKPTIVNLTNHSYFNLAGRGTILDHGLTLKASAFTPIGPDLIPTGEIADVEETPMDFRDGNVIGERIGDAYDQLDFAGGYDHNFVLNDHTGIMRLAARLHDAASGRTLEVFTTQPGIQFYSGNFLDGTITGKNGIVYEKHAGLCLETQHFPDSPNHPQFPTTVLEPGQEYKESTIWRFAVR